MDSDTPPNLHRSQLEVLAGMAIGIGLGAGIGFLLWRHLGVSARPAEIHERLAFAAKWSLVPAICLLVGIAMVANHRFFSRAIDPLDTTPDRTLAIWRHYLTNTQEQTVLFVIGAGAFAAVTPLYWLKAIPIIAALFALGRLLFIIGYLIRPTWRAAGFALTFYPIVGLYAVATWLYWF